MGGTVITMLPGPIVMMFQNARERKKGCMARSQDFGLVQVAGATDQLISFSAVYVTNVMGFTKVRMTQI